MPLHHRAPILLPSSALSFILVTCVWRVQFCCPRRHTIPIVQAGPPGTPPAFLDISHSALLGALCSLSWPMARAVVPTCGHPQQLYQLPQLALPMAYSAFHSTDHRLCRQGLMEPRNSKWSAPFHRLPNRLPRPAAQDYPSRDKSRCLWLSVALLWVLFSPCGSGIFPSCLFSDLCPAYLPRGSGVDEISTSQGIGFRTTSLSSSALQCTGQCQPVLAFSFTKRTKRLASPFFTVRHHSLPILPAPHSNIWHQRRYAKKPSFKAAILGAGGARALRSDNPLRDHISLRKTDPCPVWQVFWM